MTMIIDQNTTFASRDTNSNISVCCMSIYSSFCYISLHIVFRPFTEKTAVWKCMSSIIVKSSFCSPPPRPWVCQLGSCQQCSKRRSLPKKSQTFQPLSCLCFHGCHSSSLSTPPHYQIICFNLNFSRSIQAFFCFSPGALALCWVYTLKSRGKQFSGNLASKCTSSDTVLNALATNTVNLLWHRVWPSFCTAE